MAISKRNLLGFLLLSLIGSKSGAAAILPVNHDYRSAIVLARAEIPHESSTPERRHHTESQHSEIQDPNFKGLRVNPKHRAFPNYYNDFVSNPYSSNKERRAIAPYLLPYNHPAKAALDLLFCRKRVSATSKSLQAAGFYFKEKQPRSFIFVAGHKSLPGYLLKIYTDDEKRIKRNRLGWEWFVQRIQGADKIRTIIEKRQITKFVVPRKWIYPLPIKPLPPHAFRNSRKNEVLLVEDMELVSEAENLDAWKYKITKKHLDEFYTIITFAGGSSYKPRNVAYTRNGKFAFIDTEYPYREPDYRGIDHYLSSAMLKYWKQLTKRK
jgi:hypothetical protein